MKRLFFALCCAALWTLRAAAEPSTAELNRIVGAPLFGRVELWKEPPAALLRRLGLNRRGERSGEGEIFAARVDREVFGCHASEIRVFASGERVKRVEFIFINKGDDVPAKKRGVNIKNKMRRSRADLEKLLRANFGRPRRGAKCS